MDCRDKTSIFRLTARSTNRILRIFLGAAIPLLSSQVVAGAETEAFRTRPQIRYESITIVSRWGPPLLKAEIGRFRVSENRRSGSARQIELAFVRLSSVSNHPGPPIVWLSGGPGDSGTADLETPALRLFLELRTLGDVIVLDQRGTGLSTPRLDCPGALHFPYNLPPDRSLALNTVESVAFSCSHRWQAEGVDLSAYNAQESAEDVEDLRLALDAQKLRLLAGSYGTHVALAVIRAHEETIDRAVLFGVVGPDQLRRLPADSDAQLERIARLAAADSAVGSGSEDLIALIRRVRDRLVAQPATLEIESVAGGRRTIVVGAFDLEWYTRALLMARSSIARVPALFEAMDEGDWSELATVADRWRLASAPSAAIFTHRCASAASPNRERRIADERASAALGDATDFAETSMCRAWNIPPLSGDFREPVRSTIPTLFVSGTLDGDTPESNAIEVMRGFPNGVRLRIEGAAHSLLGFEDIATRETVTRFFESGRVRKTVIALPPLVFERRDARRIGALLAREKIPVPSLFETIR